MFPKNQIINEQRSQKLKYDEPSIPTLTKAKLTKEMDGFLKENMDGELMGDDVVEYWLREENQELIEEMNLDEIDPREEEA